MVGYDTQSGKLSQMDVMLAGGASGFITRAVCQPLDVIKIRFQLQVEPVASVTSSKYHSVIQAVRTIHQEEGLSSLWKGHVPAQLLSVVYGLSQFWCFEVLSKKANSINAGRHKSLINFSCGAVAGCTATVASFPFDVVRTRMVAQNEHHKVYSGVVEAFVQMLRREGFFVFFRGMLPTIIQVAPHAGMQFMCYKLFDSVYRKLTSNSTSNFTLSGSVISGGLAGLCSKAAVYPFDLTRKRLQVQGFDYRRKSMGKLFICKGMIDCFIKTYKQEALLGFFKGLSPSLVKAVSATALHFTSYDFICKLLAENRI